ncbi:NuoI/complex I 23 kDa subunit family protein [Nonomuraea ferruginea]
MARIPGVGLARGLTITLRRMLRRSVTQQYPEVKPDLPPRSRGVIALVEENCTSCMLCARECPDWCIYIDSHKETIPAPEGGRPRQRNVLDRFAIDFALCMYCGICIEVCPFDALFWSPEFEYAEGDIRNLLHEKDKLATWVPTVPPPPPHDSGADLPKELSAAPRRPARARGAEPSTPSRPPRTSTGPAETPRKPEARTTPTEALPASEAPPTGRSHGEGPHAEGPHGEGRRAEGAPRTEGPTQTEGADASPGAGSAPPATSTTDHGNRPSATSGAPTETPSAGGGPTPSTAGESDQTSSTAEASGQPSSLAGDSGQPSSTVEESGQASSQAGESDQASSTAGEPGQASSTEGTPGREPSTDGTPGPELSTGGESGEKLSTGSARSQPEPGSGEQTSGARPRRRRMADPRSIRPPGRLGPEEPKEREEE